MKIIKKIYHKWLEKYYRTGVKSRRSVENVKTTLKASGSLFNL